MWIVLEENPRPDNYIVILMMKNSSSATELQTKHSVHTDRTAAIQRAVELKNLYRVRGIRIFYSDGHSSNLSRSETTR